MLAMYYQRTFKVLILTAVFYSFQTLALPTGPQVIDGAAGISSENQYMQINQTTNQALINWQTFNINYNEHVHFNQPNSNALTINRINPTNGPSNILGRLSATGQIFLLNPAGVVFGQNAQIDVAGILASTSDINTQAYLNGSLEFLPNYDYSGSVINHGQISIKDNGYAAFVAPTVINHGIIRANLGRVELASGDAFTVDLYGDNLINFKLPPDKVNQLRNYSIDHQGEIYADGGSIIMTAQDIEDVVSSVINMNGYAQANQVLERGGEIIFSAGKNGHLTFNSNSGTEASQGTVKARAKHIELNDNASINVSSLNENGHAGEISIGGYYLGELKSSSDYNALTVNVDENVNILANANVAGDGGSVFLWSDGITSLNGNIQAMGGTLLGNGGFIETSGKYILDIQESANVTTKARNGSGVGGTWLLDPAILEINDTLADLISTDLDNSSGGKVNITTQQPDSNIDVIDYSSFPGFIGYNTPGIDEVTEGVSLGDVIFNNDVTPISWSSNARFIVNAGANIRFNVDNAINSSGGGHIELIAASQNVSDFGTDISQGLIYQNTSLSNPSVIASNGGRIEAYIRPQSNFGQLSTYIDGTKGTSNSSSIYDVSSGSRYIEYHWINYDDAIHGDRTLLNAANVVSTLGNSIDPSIGFALFNPKDPVTSVNASPLDLEVIDPTFTGFDIFRSHFDGRDVEIRNFKLLDGNNDGGVVTNPTLQEGHTGFFSETNSSIQSGFSQRINNMVFRNADIEYTADPADRNGVYGAGVLIGQATIDNNAPLELEFINIANSTVTALPYDDGGTLYPFRSSVGLMLGKTNGIDDYRMTLLEYNTHVDVSGANNFIDSFYIGSLGIGEIGASNLLLGRATVPGGDTDLDIEVKVNAVDNNTISQNYQNTVTENSYAAGLIARTTNPALNLEISNLATVNIQEQIIGESGALTDSLLHIDVENYFSNQSVHAGGWIGDFTGSDISYNLFGLQEAFIVINNLLITNTLSDNSFTNDYGTKNYYLGGVIGRAQNDLDLNNSDTLNLSFLGIVPNNILIHTELTSNDFDSITPNIYSGGLYGNIIADNFFLGRGIELSGINVDTNITGLDLTGLNSHAGGFAALTDTNSLTLSSSIAINPSDFEYMNTSYLGIKQSINDFSVNDTNSELNMSTAGIIASVNSGSADFSEIAYSNITTVENEINTPQIVQASQTNLYTGGLFADFKVDNLADGPAALSSLLELTDTNNNDIFDIGTVTTTYNLSGNSNISTTQPIANIISGGIFANLEGDQLQIIRDFNTSFPFEADIGITAIDNQIYSATKQNNIFIGALAGNAILDMYSEIFAIGLDASLSIHSSSDNLSAINHDIYSGQYFGSLNNTGVDDLGIYVRQADSVFIDNSITVTGHTFDHLNIYSGGLIGYGDLHTFDISTTGFGNFGFYSKDPGSTNPNDLSIEVSNYQVLNENGTVNIFNGGLFGHVTLDTANFDSFTKEFATTIDLTTSNPVHASEFNIFSGGIAAKANIISEMAFTDEVIASVTNLNLNSISHVISDSTTQINNMNNENIYIGALFGDINANNLVLEDQSGTAFNVLNSIDNYFNQIRIEDDSLYNNFKNRTIYAGGLIGNGVFSNSLIFEDELRLNNNRVDISMASNNTSNINAMLYSGGIAGKISPLNTSAELQIGDTSLDVSLSTISLDTGVNEGGFNYTDYTSYMGSFVGHIENIDIIYSGDPFNNYQLSASSFIPPLTNAGLTNTLINSEFSSDAQAELYTGGLFGFYKHDTVLELPETTIILSPITSSFQSGVLNNNPRNLNIYTGGIAGQLDAPTLRMIDVELSNTNLNNTITYNASIADSSVSSRIGGISGYSNITELYLIDDNSVFNLYPLDYTGTLTFSPNTQTQGIFNTLTSNQPVIFESNLYTGGMFGHLNTADFTVTGNLKINQNSTADLLNIATTTNFNNATDNSAAINMYSGGFSGRIDANTITHPDISANATLNTQSNEFDDISLRSIINANDTFSPENLNINSGIYAGYIDSNSLGMEILRVLQNNSISTEINTSNADFSSETTNIYQGWAIGQLIADTVIFDAPINLLTSSATQNISLDIGSGLFMTPDLNIFQGVLTGKVESTSLNYSDSIGIVSPLLSTEIIASDNSSGFGNVYFGGISGRTDTNDLTFGYNQPTVFVGSHSLETNINYSTDINSNVFASGNTGYLSSTSLNYLGEIDQQLDLTFTMNKDQPSQLMNNNLYIGNQFAYLDLGSNDHTFPFLGDTQEFNLNLDFNTSSNNPVTVNGVVESYIIGGLIGEIIANNLTFEELNIDNNDFTFNSFNDDSTYISSGQKLLTVGGLIANPNISGDIVFEQPVDIDSSDLDFTASGIETSIVYIDYYVGGVFGNFDNDKNLVFNDEIEVDFEVDSFIAGDSFTSDGIDIYLGGFFGNLQIDNLRFDGRVDVHDSSNDNIRIDTNFAQTTPTPEDFNYFVGGMAGKVKANSILFNNELDIDYDSIIVDLNITNGEVNTDLFNIHVGTLFGTTEVANNLSFNDEIDIITGLNIDQDTLFDGVIGTEGIENYFIGGLIGSVSVPTLSFANIVIDSSSNTDEGLVFLDIEDNAEYSTFETKNIYLGGLIGDVNVSDVINFNGDVNFIDSRVSLDNDAGDDNNPVIMTNLYQGGLFGRLQGTPNITFDNLLSTELEIDADAANAYISGGHHSYVGGLFGNAEINNLIFNSSLNVGEGQDLAQSADFFGTNNTNSVNLYTGGIAGKINANTIEFNNTVSLNYDSINSDIDVSDSTFDPNMLNHFVGGIFGDTHITNNLNFNDTIDLNTSFDIDHRVISFDNATVSGIENFYIAGLIGSLNASATNFNGVNVNNIFVYLDLQDFNTYTATETKNIYQSGLIGLANTGSNTINFNGDLNINLDYIFQRVRSDWYIDYNSNVGGIIAKIENGVSEINFNQPVNISYADLTDAIVDIDTFDANGTLYVGGVFGQNNSNSTHFNSPLSIIGQASESFNVLVDNELSGDFNIYLGGISGILNNQVINFSNSVTIESDINATQVNLDATEDVDIMTNVGAISGEVTADSILINSDVNIESSITAFNQLNDDTNDAVNSQISMGGLFGKATVTSPTTLEISNGTLTIGDSTGGSTIESSNQLDATGSLYTGGLIGQLDGSNGISEISSNVNIFADILSSQNNISPDVTINNKFNTGHFTGGLIGLQKNGTTVIYNNINLNNISVNAASNGVGLEFIQAAGGMYGGLVNSNFLYDDDTFNFNANNSIISSNFGYSGGVIGYVDILELNPTSAAGVSSGQVFLDAPNEGADWTSGAGSFNYLNTDPCQGPSSALCNGIPTSTPPDLTLDDVLAGLLPTDEPVINDLNYDFTTIDFLALTNTCDLTSEDASTVCIPKVLSYISSDDIFIARYKNNNQKYLVLYGYPHETYTLDDDKVMLINFTLERYHNNLRYNKFNKSYYILEPYNIRH